MVALQSPVQFFSAFHWRRAFGCLGLQKLSHLSESGLRVDRDMDLCLDNGLTSIGPFLPRFNCCRYSKWLEELAQTCATYAAETSHNLGVGPTDPQSELGSLGVMLFKIDILRTMPYHSCQLFRTQHFGPALNPRVDLGCPGEFGLQI